MCLRVRKNERKSKRAEEEGGGIRYDSCSERTDRQKKEDGGGIEGERKKERGIESEIK